MQSSAFEAGRTVGAIVGSLLCLGLSLGAVAAVVLAFVKRTTGWIVAAAVFAFLGFAAMITVGVFAFREVRNEAQAQKRPKPMVSDDGWVRVQVPGSWKNLPELNAGASLKAGNTLAEQYLTVFSDPRSDFRGTLDEFASLTTERMRKSLKEGSMGTPQHLIINGYPAVRVRLEGTASSVHICYLHTSVETPDGFHQIVQWTLPSKEAQAFPVFEQVAGSFELARPPAVPPAKPKPLATPRPAVSGERL